MKTLIFSLLLLFSFTVGTGASSDTRFVVTQSTPTDCGPAALATLLTYHLGVATTKEEMMRLARYRPDEGTNLLGLEEAAHSKGCAADSFRMSYETLKKQLATYRTPVLVRTLTPAPHFSVVLATDNYYVYISDPAIGNLALQRQAFLRLWEIPRTRAGYVLVVAKPGHHVDASRVAQIVKELRRGRKSYRSVRRPHHRERKRSNRRR